MKKIAILFGVFLCDLFLLGCPSPVYQTTTTTSTSTTTTLKAVTTTTTTTVAATYSVTYAGNGSTSGTVPVDSNKYAQGAAVTVLGNPGGLAKINFIFSGWSTTASGTALGATFSIGTNNVTLYAVWIQLAQWAQTVNSGTTGSIYNGVAVDSSGDAYAVGYITNANPFNFGGVSSSVSGPYSGANAVIVKYNSSGVAQWAQTVSAAMYQSYFSGVAVDSSGNAYAVGQISNGSFNFGGACGTINGPVFGSNTVIVKYNSSGVAQWAETVSTASSGSYFNGVAVDSSNSAYAVGIIQGTSAFDFGGSSTPVTGSYSGSTSTVIVKYDSSGIAQWAQTLSGATNATSFSSVAVDSSGNAYAVGSISGSGSCNFGNSVTVMAPFSGASTVLVKYNSSGTAQWAETENSGTGSSQFNSVAVDRTGDVYAVGSIWGGAYGFGGSAGLVYGPDNSSDNSVIVKYNSSATAQWAQTENTAQNSSDLLGVAVDSSGNAYAVGTLYTGTFSFGGNTSPVAGPYSGGTNTVIVKYSTTGLAQWAQAISTGANSSVFNSVGIDGSGNTYAVGYISGGTYNFSSASGQITAPTSSTNAVAVKYAAH